VLATGLGAEDIIIPNDEEIYGTRGNWDAFKREVGVRLNEGLPGDAAYSYDGVGRVVQVDYGHGEKRTLDYLDFLNLPLRIQKGNSNIENYYTAEGQKYKSVRSIEANGSVEETETVYMGEVELVDGSFHALNHEEGRMVLDETQSLRKEFFLKYHLGNIRVRFEDEDGDGRIRRVLPAENEPSESEVISSHHYYPFGLECKGHFYQDASKEIDRHRYNGKELESVGLYDYGFRCYDPAVGRFLSVDPLAEKYSGWSPYNYVLGNPIRNIDPQGDTVRVAVGNEFISYTPGMEYTGDNKFAQGVINSLNTMNTSEAGGEVLGSLVTSENNYSFVNVVSTDKNGNPVEGVRFRRGENGSGTIEAGASTDVGTIVHELFHGYKIESGMNPATTAGEVGAYLFQDVVTLQASVPFGSSSSTNEYGMKYDAAHSNLLYNGFNDADYISANIFFKFSSKNATGLYNRTKRTISTFPKPPIAKFLPAFK